ncbi:MAG: molecular chaperone [Betaproteobacteria bacterium]
MKQARSSVLGGAGRVLAAVLAATWALGGGPWAGTAAAATFTVDPTQIFISGRTQSALLTLRNQSTETLRFQLSVFAWSQAPSGRMALEPTQDIVFFPALLILKPAEERNVRIGSTTGFDVREKTYRIFVEELPPATRPAGSAAGVRVLTKMGIPIFLRPPKEIAAAALTDLRQEDGSLKFTLTNTGTVHFLPQTITVRGLVGDAPAFERRLDAWYVLAGGRRDFEMPIPKDDCARLTSVAVEVQFGSDKLQERLQTPGGACAR